MLAIGGIVLVEQAKCQSQPDLISIFNAVDRNCDFHATEAARRLLTGLAFL